MSIVLSVTFVLAFGEVNLAYLFSVVDFGAPFSLCNHHHLTLQVIPQSICSRYGIAVGANLAWLVRILMIICYPIAFPVGKVILNNF